MHAASDLFTSLYYRAVVASNAPRLALTLLSLVLLSGCANTPAFRASLLSELDIRHKAIAIIGDLQQTSAFVRFVRRRENNEAEQQQLMADLRGQIDELAALVIVGDLVFSARSQSDWNHLDSLVAPFAQRIPVLAVTGNHDYPCYLVEFCRSSKMAGGMQARFPWVTPGQPWSVAAGRLQLLFLDSESELESQGAWLKEQLDRAANEFDAAIVFFHRPAFSNSIDRGANGNEDVQRFIVPALSAAPLPAIAISGHVHGFEYIVHDGVHYVTTAGGGGPRGPMPAGPRPDAYRGPDCIREDNGAVLRPFNYLMLRDTTRSIRIEVRGFCRGDANVRVLDTIEIGL